MKKLVILLATWGGVGFFPFAPGTAGTVAAIPLFLPLSLLPLYGYIPCVLAIGLAACWAAGRAEQIFGEQDNRRIVIDEVVGLLVTMAAVPLTWPSLLVGLCLFRAFDILKPPPIRLIERRVKGGWGVVLDDVVAGIYAQISLRIVLYVFSS
ncbi:MAG: phosphatidylglycerophosphatase A [Deltaproteobacteria bacterium]|nr:phosphatidylglycerophosphatase A [Deltaproteobacteria bacterium]